MPQPEYEFVPIGVAPTDTNEFEFVPVTESGFMEEFGKGLVRGALRVGKGFVGTAETAAKYFPTVPNIILRKALYEPKREVWFPKTGWTKMTGYEAVGEMKKRIGLAEQQFPRTSTDATGWAGAVIGEAIPYMASSLAGGYMAGLPGAAAVGFSVEGDSAYEDAKERGASEGQAQLERVVVGSINAAIEALQIGQIMKFAKAGKYSLKGFIQLARGKAYREMMKSGLAFSGDLLKNSINEGIEEFAQEGVSILVPAAFRGDVPRTEEGKTDWVAIGKRMGEAALGGFVAGGVLGAGARVVSPKIETKLVEKPEPLVERPAGEEIDFNAEARRLALEEVGEKPVGVFAEAEQRKWEKKYNEAATKHYVRLIRETTQPSSPAEKQAAKPTSEILPQHRELFRQAAEQAKEVAPEVQTEIHRARGKIAAEMKPKIISMQERGVPTEEAIKRSIPKGALTEYAQRFPSIREALGNETVESYFNTIPKNPVFAGREYAMKHTQEAFTKLLDGSYLTLTEVGYLNKHFGRIAPEVVELAQTRIPAGDRAWQIAREIANIPYTTLTSIADMSGLLRQGRFLAQRYPELSPEFAKKYADSFMSEESAQRIMDEIASNPNMERAKRVGGLELTELPSFYQEATETEETKIASPLLERIPILGKYFIRPTSRSFTAALNWYRMAIVDRVMSTADRAGKPLTNKQLRKLCSDVNDMSGRSTLPKALKRMSPFINSLFAPRFTISRVKLLGKMFYRPNVAISMASFIGTNMLIMGLAKMLWPDDVEIEPDLRAADGGKIKVGNMRIDLWAGELPIIRSIIRLATGETKTSTGRYVPIDYKREIFNIFRARSSPGASLLIDALTGNTFIGEQFGAPPKGEWGKQLEQMKIPKWMQGLGKETWNRLGPLTMQDSIDTFIEEGLPMAITATVLSGSGIGVQTYPEMPNVTAMKLKDSYSKLYFGVDKWDDLGPLQQKALRQKYAEIRGVEQAVKVEGAKRISDYKYVARLIVEEKKAGREVYKKLNKPMRNALDTYGISLGLSRKVGDWRMNDEKYERYKYLTTKGLNKFNINRIMQSNMTDEQKTKAIQLIINTVKKAAREIIVRETYKQMPKKAG